MPKKRVLVVDDNRIVRSYVRQLFEAEPDFELSGEADNGRDAIEQAEALKPDLIILDLSMPGMTGLDVVPLLKKSLPAVRIILFTVYEGYEVDRLASAAGIHAVVSKYQAAPDLIVRARTLLASTEQREDPKLRHVS
jgi:two-component system response regulator NreC